MSTPEVALGRAGAWKNAERLVKEPLIEPGKAYKDVTEDVCRPLENLPTGLWWKALAASVAAMLLGVLMMALTIWTGIGQWGENWTVGWAFDITNSFSGSALATLAR